MSHFDVTLQREGDEIVARVRVRLPAAGGDVVREFVERVAAESVGWKPGDVDVMQRNGDMQLARKVLSSKDGAAAAGMSDEDVARWWTGLPKKTRVLLRKFPPGDHSGVFGKILRPVMAVIPGGQVALAAERLAKGAALSKAGSSLASAATKAALRSAGVAPEVVDHAAHIASGVAAAHGAQVAAAANKPAVAKALVAKAKKHAAAARKLAPHDTRSVQDAGRQVFYLTLTPR